MPQYTEADVDKLLKDIETEFSAHLAKAEGGTQSLAKAEGSEKEKKPEGKEEGKESAPPSEGEGKEAPAKEAAPAEGEGKEAAPPAAEGEGESHGYDPEDLEHMEKMYRSMSKGEQKAHSDCLAKCMGGGAEMGKAEITHEEPKGSPGAKAPATKEQDTVGKEIKKADGCGGEMGANPPKGSPGAQSPASKEQDKISKEKMSKTETGKIEANPPKGSPGAKSPASEEQDTVGKEVSMGKSENTEVNLLKSEVEAEKAKNSELKKSLDAVTEFIAKLNKKIAPPAKAITTLDAIQKSEGGNEKQLTKGEVTAILAKKAQDPNLNKSDRDAINAFYLNSASIESVSHLLR